MIAPIIFASCEDKVISPTLDAGTQVILDESFNEVAFPGLGEFSEVENSDLYLRKIDDNCYVYGLDMLLTKEQVEELDDIICTSSYYQPETRGTVATQTKYNWPDKTIPYTFNSNITTRVSVLMWVLYKRL